MCYQKFQTFELMITPDRSRTILEETRKDCMSDLRESLFLIRDLKHKLNRFTADIKHVKVHIDPTTYSEVLSTALSYMRTLNHKIDTIQVCYKALSRTPITEARIAQVTALKNGVYEYVRTHSGSISALITATDWQSPSYGYSSVSQAGRQTGTIYATINDYKRDQHADAHRYERAFVKEYVDALLKFPVQAYACSCGMAAFTTILNFLIFDKKITGPVIMGKSVYHENKELIKNAFGSSLIEVEESDTTALLRIISKKRPSAIFLDSLTNAPRLTVPELTTIIKHILASVRQETYLIIDNTCHSLFFQPFTRAWKPAKHLRLIVLESLVKFHQFGTDRVTGGIIWGMGHGIERLFDYREHLGTNIPDSAAVTLPSPNRELLTARLQRFGRNTKSIAAALTDWIAVHPDSPFYRIWYPGIPDNPIHTSVNRTFAGAYFTIEFKKQMQTISTYRRFITAVMKEARCKHIPIIEGTSFGFNTTRIYLTAVRSHQATPFIRVAPGTEHARANEAIINLFLNIFCHFR
jgi:cystathionine beta-lyase/cystathionine gamma-synthase